ncbi:MAG: hypothetical protein WD491_06110, partial [Balneolales bacterium]
KGLNPASMERIIWVKARLADHVYFEQADHPTDQEIISDYLKTYADSPAIESISEVINAYEDLLVAYPQGYYAEKARERIKELSNIPN